MDVIVVDNGATTDLRDIKRVFPDARIVQTNRPMGFADANNFALARLSEHVSDVCFLNQDTMSTPGWIDSCVAALNADAKRGAVIPLIKTYDQKAWDEAFWDCAGQAEGLRESLASGKRLEGFFETPVAPAAAMMVRAEALNQAGPFDPVFGSYYEDYDLCRRIRSAGYTIGIVGDATIAHFSGSATLSDADRRRRGRAIVRNRILYEIRLAGANRMRAVFGYLLTIFPRNLVRSILRRSAHPPAEFFGGHWDLLKLLPRLLSERRDRETFKRETSTIIPDKTAFTATVS